jgi:hypothetical protein
MNDNDRICVPNCPSPLYGNPLTAACASSCPSNYFKQSNGRICQSICDLGTYADSTTGHCVITCPTNYL